MSHKSIWLISLILSLVVWIGFRQWKPYFFEQMLSDYSIQHLVLNESITWEPATLISLLLIGFSFLLFSNILHALFYGRKVAPTHRSTKSPDIERLQSSDINSEERIREQILRRANSIDRKDHWR